LRIHALPLIASWGGVLLVAASTVGAIFHLHQLRPGNDVLMLNEAHFTSSRDLTPPTAVHEAIKVSLPDNWRSRPPFANVGWYRVTLDLQVAPNRLWGIYLPNLEMAPTVFVNDVMVGGFSTEAPLPRLWNRPVYFSIPSGILKPGSNQIAVRLASHGATGRLGEIYIGPDEILQVDYLNRYILRVSTVQLTAVMGLVVGLFIGGLFLARLEATYGWFALFALSWTLHNHFILTVNVPVANVLWDLYVYSLIGVMLVFGSLFTFRFLNISSPRWERLLIVTSAVGPCVMGLLAFVDLEWFYLFSERAWYMLLVLLMFYPIILMTRAVIRLPDLEILVLTTSYLIMAALTVHDWTVLAGIGSRNEGLLMQFASGPVFLTFGIILVRRFVLALRESDTLKSNLEARVDQKSRELAVSFRQLQESEVQRTLLAERARLMRDMHDGIGSQLIGVIARLSPAAERERHIAGELRMALDDLRMMIDSMDDVGHDLVSVLGLFRHRVQPQLDDAGLILHWDMTDLPPIPDLGPERVLHFLRMLQEIVTNAIKHAHATNLWIRTLPAADVAGRPCIAVEIEDDGCGLPDSVTEGRGLRNLRHRSLAANLCMDVERGLRGTRIRLGVPVGEPSVEETA
jgi:signal transduction histidine kinase